MPAWALLLGLIGLTIRIIDGVPILYRQDRMGLNNSTFSIIKFRTMPVGSDRVDNAVWSKPDSIYATKFGSFLRQTGLDELPQLINVLKGDMSLVGPRPWRASPDVFEELERDTPEYKDRLKVLPGLVPFSYTRSDPYIKPKFRVKYDLIYIERRNLCMDTKILVRVSMLTSKRIFQVTRRYLRNRRGQQY